LRNRAWICSWAISVIVEMSENASSCMYTSVGGGGAEGEEMSVLGEDDFGLPFLYTTNNTRAMRITVPIIPAGEENNQRFDWKGLLKKISKRCRISLASKVPETTSGPTEMLAERLK
jgi:hypothetical protein